MNLSTLEQIAHSNPLLLEELACQCEHVNLVNMDSYGQAVAKDAVRAEQEVHSTQPTLSPVGTIRATGDQSAVDQRLPMAGVRHEIGHDSG